MRLVLPVPFDPATLPAFLSDLAACARSNQVEVDVAEASRSPAGAVVVASLVAFRRSLGLETVLEGAGANHVASLEPIVDLVVARRQGDAAAELLERELPGAAQSVMRAARFVAEELGANIVQHSDAPATGFGALATFPASGRFQLASADSGVGFLQSLQRHPEFATGVQDDAEAIQLAVEKGLTSVGGRSNMGMGLGVLCDLSDRLGAELWILSGTGLWHRRTAPHGLRVATTRVVTAYRGAVVCLDAPATPNA